MNLVGGRPEEKGDERIRTWTWEGEGGGDDEGKEASLDALVTRAAGLRNNALTLMLKQRRAAVLRAWARPPPVTSDSIAKGILVGLGKNQTKRV